ncbi:M24 family metallopeptidase [Bacillus sp. NEB1478]|uniref:M24 family metallopeptidase n=1 Tax=Bacillus sp. NEB1478 TaxID=3073816 RepID=UPI0028732BEF|nr:M24 family metallopeptidase [Bacillus sp. NEB1478]WNB93885.1 M24 family metallopeptidase [Bacillus sp. NEB1478]
MKVETINHITILTLAERDKLKDQWLLNRLQLLLPSLMQKHGLDMWITIGREYNEDPIGLTFFPSAIDSSRRLTIFVFVKDKKGEINRFVIHPNKEFEPFYTCFPIKTGESAFEALREIMDSYSPDNIAVNKSSHYAFCDGLSHSFYETLLNTIGRVHAKKIISSESIALDWLQLRTESELDKYKDLANITQSIVKMTLSKEVIKPHVTTTNDVVSWIRQKVLDLGLKTSFYPTVDIQRKHAEADRITGTILPGDIVHLDFGIEYLGLCTDTQQLAYVLQPNETDIPEGLNKALQIGNDFEDLFFETCKTGMSGNQLFKNVMKKAEDKGIKAMLYSHPIGSHCHAAGPIIGLYDKQEEVPVKGELTIQNNTCYALEFNIRTYISEWQQDIPIYLEESVCFKGDKMHYLTERQTSFHIITL